MSTLVANQISTAPEDNTWMVSTKYSPEPRCEYWLNKGRVSRSQFFKFLSDNPKDAETFERLRALPGKATGEA